MSGHRNWVKKLKEMDCLGFIYSPRNLLCRLVYIAHLFYMRRQMLIALLGSVWKCSEKKPVWILETRKEKWIFNFHNLKKPLLSILAVPQLSKKHSSHKGKKVWQWSVKGQSEKWSTFKKFSDQKTVRNFDAEAWQEKDVHQTDTNLSLFLTNCWNWHLLFIQIFRHWSREREADDFRKWKVRFNQIANSHYFWQIVEIHTWHASMFFACQSPKIVSLGSLRT